LPKGKAGKVLKQANYEHFGAVKASQLKRENTWVTPEARVASRAPRQAATRKQTALQITEGVNRQSC
jgi:hypothetical protein